MQQKKREKSTCTCNCSDFKYSIASSNIEALSDYVLRAGEKLETKIRKEKNKYKTMSLIFSRYKDPGNLKRQFTLLDRGISS
jgi:uncharacterized protein YfcZ (UPF0381/DUF406 family)